MGFKYIEYHQTFLFKVFTFFVLADANSLIVLLFTALNADVIVQYVIVK